MRPAFEVADVFNRHGQAYIDARGGHIGRIEQRVMSAIQLCRTAALGGHVEACEACGATRPAYNSCRNRHCPKCQGAAQAQWVERREADLLPVPYFHVVFTMPAPIADIAFHNKAVVYAILFKAASTALRTIAADPRHLGADIGLIAVLHTWGQTLHHHPHVHCVVPGGGLSLDGARWIPPRRSRFFLPVKVLSRLYRRLFLEELAAAFQAGELAFPGATKALGDPTRFTQALSDWRKLNWVVFAKPPFGGPAQVLAYLGRYTHRVAIANSRILSIDGDTVSFSWRDYRANGQTKIMTVSGQEFIRRFLQHTLPDGFHRIRHYGFLANGQRVRKIECCRRLLADAAPTSATPRALDLDPATASSSPSFAAPSQAAPRACSCCGGVMRITSVLPPPSRRAPPATPDTS